jgi:hypothetical protein
MSIKAGAVSGYKVKVTVLVAPTAKGLRGRVRIEPDEGSNVLGDEIDVLVCD